jgi:hypothetical protein
MKATKARMKDESGRMKNEQTQVCHEASLGMPRGNGGAAPGMTVPESQSGCASQTDRCFAFILHPSAFILGI